jgi:hypothetical protein
MIEEYFKQKEIQQSLLHLFCPVVKVAMEKFKGQFYGSECFTEDTHVSLKYLQCFTAAGYLTYILRAFRVLRSVLFVRDGVHSDLRIGFEKGILSGNRNGEGQRQQTGRKCDRLLTLTTRKIDYLKTNIKLDYI